VENVYVRRTPSLFSLVPLIVPLVISPTALLVLPACKSQDLIVIGGLEQTSPANAIFLSIVEVKTH
jgi:hypothetical protein